MCWLFLFLFPGQASNGATGSDSGKNSISQLHHFYLINDCKFYFSTKRVIFIKRYFTTDIFLYYDSMILCRNYGFLSIKDIILIFTFRLK
jgi:hypothetical protein